MNKNNARSGGAWKRRFSKPGGVTGSNLKRLVQCSRGDFRRCAVFTLLNAPSTGERSLKPRVQTHVMPLVVFLLLIMAALPLALHAQSFEKGVSLYEEGKYREAAAVFTRLDSDQAKLFAGKAYFGLGEYLTAKAWLQKVDSESDDDVYLETQYTLALANFQLGLFGEALNRLHTLKNQESRTQVVNNGNRLYRDILNYLTLDQRKAAYQLAQSDEVKLDLVSSAIGRVDYPVAKVLYRQLKKSRLDTTAAGMQELSEMLVDSATYSVERVYNNQLQAPDGITYNIGAALPSYPGSAPEHKVSRGLYLGFIYAAEQFNQQHNNQKAFIRYQNTGADRDSAGYAMTELAWNFNADAVLGPLFSKPARRMAQMAERYQIPMIAPLANSDNLNVDNPYMFQANPTFKSHGRKMARFAVNKLNMDTLAVIAEENSLGKASAFTFRDEAEKLGAKVVHFFVDNFQEKGYDISEYTKYFSTDRSRIDTTAALHHLDAVYAPFTGQAAPTLIDLLLVNLEAMNSNLTVLGSQEFGQAQIPKGRLGNQRIFYSDSFYSDKNNPKIKQFRKEFRQRFDVEPNRFAMIGYDTAAFLLQTLNRVGNPALLKDALKKQPRYEGVISNISFGNTHINQEVEILRLTRQGATPVQ